jgi:hypothetical protein
MGLGRRKEQDEFRAAVTLTVVWVAGLTLAFMFTAVMVGLWLDRIFSVKPIFTIVIVLASVPLTLFLTVKIVRKETRRLLPNNSKDTIVEVPNSGK